MLKIQVKNLGKAFGAKTILQDISFNAAQGDVVALLGKSGSGKSTLLRCLNLLAIPDSGIVQINNEVMNFNPQTKLDLTNNQIKQLRQNIGIVFQQFNLWAHMTVLDNLIIAPMHVFKKPKQQAIEEARILLEKVGLLDKVDQYPLQLSGGQQQRAAIARALMMKPEIMLFDEPTSALDPEMVGEVLTVMKKLAADGMTMIIATHEMGFARRVANQCIFLEEGKLIEQGETVKMFNNPQSTRLQNFLCAMQF